jgi:hypothetical protein
MSFRLGGLDFTLHPSTTLTIVLSYFSDPFYFCSLPSPDSSPITMHFNFLPWWRPKYPLLSSTDPTFFFHSGLSAELFSMRKISISPFRELQRASLGQSTSPFQSSYSRQPHPKASTIPFHQRCSHRLLRTCPQSDPPRNPPPYIISPPRWQPRASLSSDTFLKSTKPLPPNVSSAGSRSIRPTPT